MDLYLCEYDNYNQTMYYFAPGGNFRDTKIHKFTYNGSYYRNDDNNVVFEIELGNDEYKYEETRDMTLEEMDKYVIKLINEGRITETLDSWNKFKKKWFGIIDECNAEPVNNDEKKPIDLL